MYDKIIVNFILIFVLLFSVAFTSSALAHKKKNHKPLVCIPEEERSKGQLQHDKIMNWWHRLSKLQQDCAMVEIEKLKGVPQVTCGNISFGHISSASSSLRIDSNKKAEKIGKIKKGDELLFISEAAGNKNWALVKVRLGKDDCAEGFMLTKLILQKAEEDVIISVGTQLIMITEPKWKKANKLIVIDAEGSISLTGAVAEGKIDKIVINDEEESIQSDNSFTALLFIPKAGVEVRLVGYKNDEIVKKLIFKIKVGN
jgi:hypothetical protein